MARLQILWLPPTEVGGARSTPFALVFDQAEGLSAEQTETLTGFGAAAGAAGTLVTDLTIEVVEDDSTDDDTVTVEFDTSELGKSLATAMRAHVETVTSSTIEAWANRQAATARISGGR